MALHSGRANCCLQQSLLDGQVFSGQCRGMRQLPTAEEIASEARAAGLSLIKMCEGAGTAYSTFYRWMQGDTSPPIGFVDRWQQEIQKHKEGRRP